MIPVCILAIEDESDREFMTNIFIRYQWLMYDTVNQIINNHWRTEDIVQVTLKKLMDKLEKLKSMDERHLVNYIITACKHTAYNEMRQSSRHPMFSLDEQRNTDHEPYAVHDMELKLIIQEDLQRMAAIWDRLDPRSQYVLEARYILEKDDAEIAAFLRVQPNSVRMILSRARKKAFELMNAKE